MSRQHKIWVSAVKEKMNLKGWKNADLAQAVGFSRKSSAITELFSKGKGSVELKLAVSRILGVDEPWNELDEQKGD